MSNPGAQEPTIQPMLIDHDESRGWFVPGTEVLTDYGSSEVLNRIRVLRGTHGFMPTSEGEANEAYSLLSFISVPGGAAKHLNEILRHQTSDSKKQVNTKDPTAAVRSVTSEYAGYAHKARADAFHLSALREELTQLGPDSEFKTLKSAHIQSGIPQFVRYVDLRRLADDGTVAIEPFARRSDGRRGALDPYTIAEPSPHMKQHIEVAAGSVRVWQARKMIGATISEQQHRKTFWVDRLHEARAHIVARPVAANALKALGLFE